MSAPNGRLPAELLGRIFGRGPLFPRAFIPQMEALCRAFEARFGKPLNITDGYRAYSGNYYAQVETMLRRYKPLAEFRRLAPHAYISGRKYHDWNGERRYLLPGESQVAFPGTSNHGRADAPAADLGSGVNVMDSEEHRWIVANAPTYGFRWPEEWARRGREPWHIEAFKLVNVSDAGTTPGIDIPTPDGTLPDPLTRTEDTPMYRIRINDGEREGGRIILVDLYRHRFITLDPAANAALERLGVPLRAVTTDEALGIRTLVSSLKAKSNIDRLDFDL